MTRFPDAAIPLKAWLSSAKAENWANLIAVRKSYPHADKAIVASNATVTIFNLGGKKYRLITAIHYNTATIYVLRFMTHAQYSKNIWKGQL
jgi:mRNA interferase HigB